MILMLISKSNFMSFQLKSKHVFRRKPRHHGNQIVVNLLNGGRGLPEQHPTHLHKVWVSDNRLIRMFWIRNKFNHGFKLTWKRQFPVA
jgi:hypothetical protein